MIKKITFLLIILTAFFGYTQNQTFDITFEGTTTGSNPLYWNVFENGTNPAFEVVANPDATGINASATVAKMTTLIAGQPYAGCETQHSTIWQWVLVDGYTTSISIDVYKSVISDVGVKMVNTTNGTVFQILKPNTTINAWETITIDLTSIIAANGENHNIDQIIIFPDWQARTTDNISYFDNISWEANKLADPVTPTCSDGIKNQDETNVDCGGTICEACPPTGLPYDFETTPVTADINSFNGGTATVEATTAPQTTGNTSTNLVKLVRDGGETWAGAYIDLNGYLDFASERYITLRIWTEAPIGTTMNLKVEEQANSGNYVELSTATTVTSGWETLSWDFSASGASAFDRLVLLFDVGSLGDGSASSTFFFDDIQQVATLGKNDYNIDNFQVYPNPTNDKWNISTKNQNISSVEVYNVLGKKVISLKPNATFASIDTSILSTGIYIATISTELGVSSRKLIKN